MAMKPSDYPIDSYCWVRKSKRVRGVDAIYLGQRVKVIGHADKTLWAVADDGARLHLVVTPIVGFIREVRKPRVNPPPSSAATEAHPAQYPWAKVDLTGGLVTAGDGYSGVVTKLGLNGAGRPLCEIDRCLHYPLSQLTPVHPTAADVGRRVRVVSTAASGLSARADREIGKVFEIDQWRHSTSPTINPVTGPSGDYWWQPDDLMLLAAPVTQVQSTPIIDGTTPIIAAPAEQPVAEHVKLGKCEYPHTGYIAFWPGVLSECCKAEVGIFRTWEHENAPAPEDFPYSVETPTCTACGDPLPWPKYEAADPPAQQPAPDPRADVERALDSSMANIGPHGDCAHCYCWGFGAPGCPRCDGTGRACPGGEVRAAYWADDVFGEGKRSFPAIYICQTCHSVVDASEVRDA
jgi:hypothetical protein